MLSRILSSLMALPALIICLTLHEAGHGLAAYLLGDRTARASGRLSLNPLRHLDPMGLLMMILFGFGWARPVPVDPSRFRNPKLGMAMTALAGPLANLLTAIVALNLVHIMPVGLQGFMMSLAGYSIALAAFNLIPIPPLDGSRVILPFLSNRAAAKWASLDRYGWIIVLLLSYSGLLTGVIYGIQRALIDLISPITFLF